eukprot:TRINITY_DN2138_c0_g2_i1.p1 TRINITY_DN2138_c0_g2~~TRINITY_DN2138_c0_g2_i1.p1  ORF type:complete len:572 (-),score=88.19 TRINITY_DN2138_c0_g2_i1:183-1898(-)
MGSGTSKSQQELGEFASYFSIGRVVGRGAFGKVFSVCTRDPDDPEDKVTHNAKVKFDAMKEDEVFALKVIDKRMLIEKSLHSKTLFERKLLEMMDHPLVVHLLGCWQTDTKLFMLFNLMLGGDLRYHLNHGGSKISEERTKFYMYQGLISLKYLSCNNVIHRDVKPDNFLLDSEGNCHLLDFNVSYRLSRSKKQTTCRGTAGTFLYMAPEVLRRERYDGKVDVWSLGVTAYECLMGVVPWNRGGEMVVDQKEKKKEILELEVHYSNKLSREAIAFLKRCICPAEDRYTIKEALEDPWFADLNYEDCKRKVAKTPWHAEEKSARIDARHDIDDTFGSRNLRSSHKPIDVDEQAVFDGWEYVPPYMTQHLPQVAAAILEAKNSRTAIRVSRKNSNPRPNLSSSDDGVLRRTLSDERESSSGTRARAASVSGEARSPRRRKGESSRSSLRSTTDGSSTNLDAARMKAAKKRGSSKDLTTVYIKEANEEGREEEDENADEAEDHADSDTGDDSSKKDGKEQRVARFTMDDGEDTVIGDAEATASVMQARRVSGGRRMSFSDASDLLTPRVKGRIR